MVQPNVLGNADQRRVGECLGDRKEIVRGLRRIAVDDKSRRVVHQRVGVVKSGAALDHPRGGDSCGSGAREAQSVIGWGMIGWSL
jgi:hypothetical protein